MASKMGDPNFTSNLLSISWHDSAWIPMLNPHNVMDYFSERSNLFYDRTCNNEVIKMQRGSMDQLHAMVGIEYELLHVQEPILYVIRKQQRHSPQQVTPLADYYIIGGIVYQAPDLGSVINSRLLTTVNHLQSAFEEGRGFSKYHPSKNYWWDFSGALKKEDRNKLEEQKKNKKKKKRSESENKKKKTKAEPSSLFQRRRVDMVLDLLVRKFPPKIPAAPGEAAAATAGKDAVDVKTEKPSETASVKSEKTETSGVAAATAATAGVKREAPSGSGGSQAKKSKTS